MKKQSRILVAACSLLAAALVVSGCGGDEKAAKEDFSAGSWILNTAVAVGNAVFGASTYGDDDTSDCNWGSTSINPVAVVNTYTTPQQLSVTINTDLANNLNFFSASSNDGSSSGISGCNLSSEYAGTQYVTVPAGSPGAPSFTVIGWVAAGGGQFGAGVGTSHNVAIGAGGTQWYDFWFHQNTLNNGFQNLELNYSNTGGTDPSQNVQTGLFNGLECSANSAGNISLDTPNTLTTPFTSDNANAWTFNVNQPLCFGFLQPNSATQS